jgi:GTP diphosphokinase / guanosine-3',5'-bis(diphosphate) 3'-diphosphatase
MKLDSPPCCSSHVRHRFTMIRFEDLLDKVRGYSPDADLELLRRAYVFSALEHKGQVRHSGEPYLVHPLEVADILADMKPRRRLRGRRPAPRRRRGHPHHRRAHREKFGEDVAHVVEGVTKISAIPFSPARSARSRTSARCCWRWWTTSASSSSSSPTGSTTCGRSSTCPRRAVRIAQETLDIYAPIANRLGMSKVKNELEELSFKYLEPTAYESLRSPRWRPSAAPPRASSRNWLTRDSRQAGGGAGAGARSTGASSASTASG